MSDIQMISLGDYLNIIQDIQILQEKECPGY